MPEVNDNPLRLIHLAVSHLAAALNSSSDETQKKQFWRSWSSRKYKEPILTSCRAGT